MDFTASPIAIEEIFLGYLLDVLVYLNHVIIILAFVSNYFDMEVITGRFVL